MMESRTCKLGFALVMGLLLVTIAACDEFWKTPTPTPTPPADIPATVLGARDAALAYVRLAYASEAPPEDVNWTGRNTTPPDQPGVSSYEFASDSWLMAIRTPLLAPDTLIYEIELSNQDTGFHWTGKLDASYAVLESNLDVAIEVLVVRDIVLSYVRERYSDQAPGEDLAWIGERTTPEGSVGHESCRFTADDWTMTVDYDLARPDQVIYRVELRNSSTGFVWVGQVDPEGMVQELQRAI
jgi:hypothetical protein